MTNAQDCFADVSPDRGSTWHRSPLIPLPDDRGLDTSSFPGEGIIQPSIYEHPPGHIHFLMRSSTGRLVRSDSTDFGRSWAPAYKTSLPNNNAGACVTRMRDGRLVVALNPVGENWGKRTPLVCMISDDGENWEEWCELENQEPPEGFEKVVALDTGIVNDGRGEFS